MRRSGAGNHGWGRLQLLGREDQYGRRARIEGDVDVDGPGVVGDGQHRQPAGSAAERVHEDGRARNIPHPHPGAPYVAAGVEVVVGVQPAQRRAPLVGGRDIRVGRPRGCRGQEHHGGAFHPPRERGNRCADGRPYTAESGGERTGRVVRQGNVHRPAVREARPQRVRGRGRTGSHDPLGQLAPGDQLAAGRGEFRQPLGCLRFEDGARGQHDRRVRLVRHPQPYAVVQP